ncbi:MAG: hypothetical protein KJ954_12460, partial [Alphaproteobacteria bacterium]|nr:hypothetical protein [Alphaproteobacteria bacterium]
MTRTDLENRYQLKPCDDLTGGSHGLCGAPGAKPAAKAESRQAPGLYDYTSAFETAIEQVKGEGRYRVFADLKRL